MHTVLCLVDMVSLTACHVGDKQQGRRNRGTGVVYIGSKADAKCGHCSERNCMAGLPVASR